MRIRRGLIFCLVILLLISLPGCKGNQGNGDDLNISNSKTSSGIQVDVSPEGLAWREEVLASPLLAEVEYKGVSYQVHVKDSLKYIYNTETSEILTGDPVVYTKGAVLKDWVSPYDKAALRVEEALFDATWEYTSTRARSLVGYCDMTYTLITRARATDYLEYIYKEKNEETYYRLAITDDFILFAPLSFSYVFDVTKY